MAKCEGTGRARRGLHVKARSSDLSTAICTIGGRSDIYHSVEVTNINPFPAAVICGGVIDHNGPRNVVFNPPHRTGPGLLSWGPIGPVQISGTRRSNSRTFNYATLATRHPGQDELIFTKVGAEWGDLGWGDDDDCLVEVVITVTG